jgi:C-terminal processing protease CtpA/Prc
MKLAPQRILVLVLAPALGACASDLPLRPPALRAMEEPLELAHEPDDEADRMQLAPGAFTGLEVGDARDSLDAMLVEPEGLLVTAVIENSPADWAGIEPGDLLLEVEVSGASGPLALAWPAEWRRIELETAPGTPLVLVVDRAGAERRCELVPVPRLHAAERGPSERIREEERAGVVLRTATEVEARAAGLGPGGGAVVVGLTRESPWRDAGIRFGDLLCAVDGVEVAHPLVVVERVRAARDGSELELELVRDGERQSVRAPLTQRASELRELSIPLLFSYEKEGDRRTLSVLLGLYRQERTPAAWRVRVLWLIRVAGGDADRLESVPR